MRSRVAQSSSRPFRSRTVRNRIGHVLLLVRTYCCSVWSMADSRSHTRPLAYIIIMIVAHAWAAKSPFADELRVARVRRRLQAHLTGPPPSPPPPHRLASMAETRSRTQLSMRCGRPRLPCDISFILYCRLSVRRLGGGVGARACTPDYERIACVSARARSR